MLADTPVIVVIPYKFDVDTIKKSDGETMVTGVNDLLNNETSPAILNIAAPKGLLVTRYGVILTIPILDQFGKTLDARYEGAIVEESIADFPDGTASPYKSINRIITSAGTYADPTGFPFDQGEILDRSIAADAARIDTWKKTDPPIPAPNFGVTKITLRIKIGGISIINGLLRDLSIFPQPKAPSTKAKIGVFHSEVK